jgi:hypothetical protein
MEITKVTLHLTMNSLDFSLMHADLFIWYQTIRYIFMDSSFMTAVRRIGYLGTHEGAHSDHCLAYVDFDEAQFLHGILNRSVPHHSREFRFTQTDKVKAYVSFSEDKYKNTEYRRRFTFFGATEKNINQYHNLYSEFLGLATSVEPYVN